MSNFVDNFTPNYLDDFLKPNDDLRIDDSKYKPFDFRHDRSHLGCLIEYDEGIVVYRFNHMLHPKYSGEHGRDIVTLGGGGLIIQLRLVDFSKFDILEFLRHLNAQEITHIRLFNPERHKRESDAPFIESIRVMPS